MTETTVAGVPDVVSDSLKDFESYLAVYALENDYTEPVRPSVNDVIVCREEIWSQVEQTAGQLEYGPDGLSSLVEGRTFYLGMSPGIISCRSTDLSARETTITQGKYGVTGRDKDALDPNNDRGAVLSASSLGVDMLIDAETGELLEESDGPSTGEIHEWSRSSRSNMSKTLASLDYSQWPVSDGALGMVTLTVPGDWKPVTPDGKTFKKLLRKLEYRWRRAVGPWRLLWKLEFQRRGAPHWHALVRIPALVTADGGYGPTYAANESNGWEGITETFESWLARTWAFVVDASREIDTVGRWIETADGFEIDRDYMVGRNQPEDSEFARHWRGGTGIDFSGKDFSDPRRISMYFAGHSAKSQDGKEYQHTVPSRWRRPGDGPGRFWGFTGLERAFAEVELTQRDFDRLRRELRKLARARAWEIAVKRAQGRIAVPMIRAPKLARSRYGGGGGQNGGWVLLNDALCVVRQLAGWMAGTAACRPGCTWCGHMEPLLGPWLGSAYSPPKP